MKRSIISLSNRSRVSSRCSGDGGWDSNVRNAIVTGGSVATQKEDVKYRLFLLSLFLLLLNNTSTFSPLSLSSSSYASSFWNFFLKDPSSLFPPFRAGIAECLVAGGGGGGGEVLLSVSLRPFPIRTWHGKRGQKKEASVASARRNRPTRTTSLRLPRTEK